MVRSRFARSCSCWACSSASDFSRAMRSFSSASAHSFSSAAIRFLSKSSGMCPFRRATPATASGGTDAPTARYRHSASGQAAVRAPAWPPQRSTVRAARSSRSVVQGAASVPCASQTRGGCSAPSRTGYSETPARSRRERCSAAAVNICCSPSARWSAWLVSSRTSLRCALRAAWRACVFTRMVSVLVMHAAMNITRNVTEYRLTSLNLSVKRGTVNR